MKKMVIAITACALFVACGGDEADGAVLVLADAYDVDCGPGNRLVFQAGEICYSDENGGGVTQVTPDSPDIVERHPCWSPDGEYIAYDAPASYGGEADIYVIAITGGPATRLTTTGGRFPA